MTTEEKLVIAIGIFIAALIMFCGFDAITDISWMDRG